MRPPVGQWDHLTACLCPSTADTLPTSTPNSATSHRHTPHPPYQHAPPRTLPLPSDMLPPPNPSMVSSLGDLLRVEQLPVESLPKLCRNAASDGRREHSGREGVSKTSAIPSRLLHINLVPPTAARIPKPRTFHHGGYEPGG